MKTYYNCAIVLMLKHLALLQDFSTIEDGWSTAACLCSILCQCCDGVRLEASLEFNETFLPNALDNMLNLVFKIQETYLATKVRQRIFILSEAIIFRFQGVDG